MKSKFDMLALAGGWMLMPAVAFATGNVDCAIDDKNVKLNFEALYSYSDIGGVFQVRGDFEAADARTYKTLRKFDLADGDIRQQWFRNNDLKLMIYRETEGEGHPFASVKLIIETTRPDEESGFDGRYKLTIEPPANGGESQAFTAEGAVSCSAG